MSSANNGRYPRYQLGTPAGIAEIEQRLYTGWSLWRLRMSVARRSRRGLRPGRN
jgi:hypothetical protein